jgi:hypothetical protein
MQIRVVTAASVTTQMVNQEGNRKVRREYFRSPLHEEGDEKRRKAAKISKTISAGDNW